MACRSRGGFFPFLLIIADALRLRQTAPSYLPAASATIIPAGPLRAPLMSQDFHQAYPGIPLNPRTCGIWARLTRRPAECVHLPSEPHWAATLVPDTVYLRGKPAHSRRPVRPEVSLCRSCLLGWLRSELASHSAQVIALQPDPESFSQYFFLAQPDFDAAGVMPAVAEALESRFDDFSRPCELCHSPSTWLCIGRDEVSSLDDWGSIRSAPGHPRCAAHGAAWFCDFLERIPEVNLLYLNLPYDGAGAYLWF